MKMQDTNNESAKLALDATRVFISDAADRINHAGKNAINSFAEGDEQRMMLMGLKRFTKVNSFNTKEARRRITAVVIDKRGYPF